MNRGKVKSEETKAIEQRILAAVTEYEEGFCFTSNNFMQPVGDIKKDNQQRVAINNYLKKLEAEGIIYRNGAAPKPEGQRGRAAVLFAKGKPVVAE